MLVERLGAVDTTRLGALVAHASPEEDLLGVVAGDRVAFLQLAQGWAPRRDSASARAMPIRWRPRGRRSATWR